MNGKNILIQAGALGLCAMMIWGGLEVADRKMAEAIAVWRLMASDFSTSVETQKEIAKSHREMVVFFQQSNTRIDNIERSMSELRREISNQK